MKRVVGPALIVVVILSGLFLGISASTQIWQRLGVSEDEAAGHIWSSFTGGYLSHPSTTRLKAIPVDARASMVRLIGDFARHHIESQAFADRYAAYRDDLKPEAPPPMTSMDEDRRQQKEQLQATIQETEANMKALPAEQQAMFDEVLKMLREQLNSVDDPDNPLFSHDMERYKKLAAEEEQKRYQERIAEWQKEYPEDPRVMVRYRLQEFLRESAGVDFDAVLKPRSDGKKIFVKPEYERKPANWKLCYRAGRETVEAARDYARQWLQDLDR